MTGSGLRLCRCENLVNLMYEVWWWKHDIFKMKISSNFSLWQKKHEIIFLFVCLFVVVLFIICFPPHILSIYLLLFLFSVFLFWRFFLVVFLFCSPRAGARPRLRPAALGSVSILPPNTKHLLRPQSAAAVFGFGVSLWAVTSAAAPWTWTHPDRFIFDLKLFHTFWPQSREMSLMIL